MSAINITDTSVPKKVLSANLPTVLTVLSAIITALVGGYVAIATKNMEGKGQLRTAEITTGSQKSIAEMQKDAQQAISAEQVKAQLALAEKQAQVQQAVSGSQRDTERYMSDARTRADREIATLSERTKAALGNQQDSVERAKLFSGLVNELADTDAHKSSVALLVLWQLYPRNDERNVIIATALAIDNKAILPTLEMLGNTDKRGRALIEHYSRQGTPQQQANANAVLGAVMLTGAGTAEQKAMVEAQVRRFQLYLNDLGFLNVLEKVTVNITAKDDAFYQEGTMTLGKNIVGDENAVLREYAHHVLTNVAATTNVDSYGDGMLAIESGLATYLACSHTGNGNSTWRFTNGLMQINLKNNDQISPVNLQNLSVVGARVWGGILWNIRELLGKTATDKLVFHTVRPITKVRGGTQTQAFRDFARRLLETDQSLNGETNQSRIRSILVNRGLTL